jgi:hypothetical protein
VHERHAQQAQPPAPASGVTYLRLRGNRYAGSGMAEHSVAGFPSLDSVSPIRVALRLSTMVVRNHRDCLVVSTKLVALDRHARSLWMDSPVRKYPSLAKAGERVDDVLLRIRVEFNAHKCQAQMFAQSTKSA